MRTQVGIIGAGPAGLVLARLLEQRGIDSVVVEKQSREHVEARMRAGVLEAGTVDLLRENGAAEQLQRFGLVHDGVNLLFDGQIHRVNLRALTGRSITVYGQNQLVQELIEQRLRGGGEIEFEAQDVRLNGIDSSAPCVDFVEQGQRKELLCDFVAGCDGLFGVSRSAIPEGAVTHYSKTLPFRWLGILSEGRPAAKELIYAHHRRGFALASMRSPVTGRYYLQCGTEENVDAAHIVPPTGAKGLNLAIADTAVLANALADFYQSGTRRALELYSEQNVVSSRAATTTFADSYAGADLHATERNAIETLHSNNSGFGQDLLRVCR